MNRKLFFGIVIVIIVLFTAGVSGLYLFGSQNSTLAPMNSSTGNVQEFAMIAKQFDFTPSKIQVEKGDTVKLTLTSMDVEHGIWIPAFNARVDFQTEKKVLEFVADKAGEFAFVCSVYCGTGHGTMMGTIEVSDSNDELEHQGSLAPDFSLTDLEGNPFQLSDFRGKVTVIDFMATWCNPCRREMPHYQTIWEKYGRDEVILLSIDVDTRESEETLRAFIQEFPYASWIWARDTANLLEVYQVMSIPKTVIIDQEGYLVREYIGVTDASTFIEIIDQLLS